MIIKKQNTREKLETKIRNNKRLLKSSLCAYVAGMALIGFGVADYKRSSSKILEPEAYKNYINAQTTLTILESEREKSLGSKLNFPYKTEKTDNLVNAIYGEQKNIDDFIDEAIIGTKEDITKMEENPKIKSYQSKTARAYKNAWRFTNGGFWTSFLGTLGIAVSLFRRNKYRAQLRAFDE